MGYLKEVLCAVGRMESYVGSVLKVLQSLDARLSELEQSNRQLGGFISGKRARDDVDLNIWDLYEFLKEKRSRYQLGFKMTDPNTRHSSLLDSREEAIMLMPLHPTRSQNALVLYIQVVDSKFRIYVESNAKFNSSDKRLVDDMVQEFQSRNNYEDIESVWKELKRLYDLDPSW